MKRSTSQVLASPVFFVARFCQNDIETSHVYLVYFVCLTHIPKGSYPKMCCFNLHFPHFFPTNYLRLGRLHAMRLTKFFRVLEGPNRRGQQGSFGWVVHHSKPLPQLMGKLSLPQSQPFSSHFPQFGITEVYESKDIQVHKVPVAMKISWL